MFNASRDLASIEAEIARNAARGRDTRIRGLPLIPNKWFWWFVRRYGFLLEAWKDGAWCNAYGDANPRNAEFFFPLVSDEDLENLPLRAFIQGRLWWTNVEIDKGATDERDLMKWVTGQFLASEDIKPKLSRSGANLTDTSERITTGVLATDMRLFAKSYLKAYAKALISNIVAIFIFYLIFEAYFVFYKNIYTSHEMAVHLIDVAIVGGAILAALSLRHGQVRRDVHTAMAKHVESSVPHNKGNAPHLSATCMVQDNSGATSTRGQRMSWKRGFLRLWIVFAVLWIGVGGWWEAKEWQEAREEVARQETKKDLCKNSQDRVKCEGIAEFLRSYAEKQSVDTLVEAAEIVFGPPLALFTIGMVIAWVIRGFRKRPES